MSRKLYVDDYLQYIICIIFFFFKLWNYDSGTYDQVGYGHSGSIQRIAISPDQSCIVSVGAEGAVFVWEFPDINENQTESYDLQQINSPKSEANDENQDLTVEKEH